MRADKTRPAMAAVVALGALAFAGHAHAGPITLNNASFELPTQVPGGIGPAGLITNWTTGGTGIAGVINIPSPGLFSVNAPDGNQVAYLTTGANISQTSGTLFQTNTNYTLSFYVGQDLVNAFSGLQAVLYEGNISQQLASFTVGAPGPNSFGLDSFSWSSLSNPYLTDNIGVAFIGGGTFGTSFVDLVNLSSGGGGGGSGGGSSGGGSGVPEPGTVAIFLTALLGWFGIKTLQRKDLGTAGIA